MQRRTRRLSAVRRPVHERVRRGGQPREEQQLDDHAAALIRLTASSKRMLSAL